MLRLIGGVLVVVHDQNALLRRIRLGLSRRCQLLVRELCFRHDAAGARRTRCPCPAPRCGPRPCRRASPPGLTSVRPIPRPPCDRSTTGPPARTSRRLRAACPAGCRSRCPRTRTHRFVALSLGGEPDATRLARCTWRRCSAGCANTWASRVGSASSDTGSDGSVTVSSWPPASMSGLARLHGTVDHRRQFHPLPCAVRFCSGMMRDTSSRSSTSRTNCWHLPLHHLPCPLDRRGIEPRHLAGFAGRCGSGPAGCGVRGPTSPGTRPCGGRLSRSSFTRRRRS